VKTKAKELGIDLSDEKTKEILVLVRKNYREEKRLLRMRSSFLSSRGATPKGRMNKSLKAVGLGIELRVDRSQIGQSILA